MSVRMLVSRRIAGLVLGIGCLTGCDGGEGSAPATGGAGIPGVRGPVSSKMPKPGAAKGRPAQGPGPTAPKAAADGSDSGATPPAPKS